MNNMVPEMIDVSEYVQNGNFIPDSCEGRLDKLIKVKPILLNKSYETVLQIKIDKWKKSSDVKIINTQNLFENTTYQYSYILHTEPVDVYKTQLETDSNHQKNIYVRLNQKGKIISDYSDVNWVQNNCEKE
ncbi:hypothetical protein [Flavobacterium pedocola]